MIFKVNNVHFFCHPTNHLGDLITCFTRYILVITAVERILSHHCLHYSTDREA